MGQNSSDPASPLGAPAFVERWYRFERIDSTNTFAKEQAEGPARGGLVVVTTKRQGAGRGQRGNTFLSDSASGLWVSIVVQLDNLEEHFGVNRSLALAACAAAREAAGVEAAIKWPNDIVVNGRKLAGILLESAPGAPGRIVAGIGLNVNTPQTDFPEEIASIATSLAMETGRVFDIDTLLERLLREFDSLRRAAPADTHRRYRAQLTGVGRAVRIGETTGVFMGVDEQGRAGVRQGGEVRYFTSGPLRFAD